RGARRLKGYTREEILGEHYSIFYTPDDREAGLPDALLTRAEHEGSVRHSGWRVRKGGTRFWADVVITPLRNRSSGELIGFAKVIRDLTDRHQMEVALQRALAREREAAVELSRLNDLRTQFLAGIAHDVRTPVIAIRDLVDLLLGSLAGTGDDEGDIDLEDALTLVADNADQLEELTRQLAEFALLERPQIELAPEALDLPTAVQHCIEPLRRTLSHVELEIDVEGVVEADPVAFRRILTNLLTNAVHNAPKGSTVRVASRQRNGEVEISVADEGPGIPTDQLDLLFEEFYQGPSPQSSRRGFGLGLAIVRNYVQRHGGLVWVESTPGAGATFRFTLPAATA
ncbi:MAG: PAS domain-containing sensor histidine kinase, partial [Actinomycetota bacterium]|nr:PAS domain-containing sensor histidine kinase [Actinomycetota bacterium]